MSLNLDLQSRPENKTNLAQIWVSLRTQSENNAIIILIVLEG